MFVVFLLSFKNPYVLEILFIADMLRYPEYFMTLQEKRWAEFRRGVNETSTVGNKSQEIFVYVKILIIEY